MRTQWMKIIGGLAISGSSVWAQELPSPTPPPLQPQGTLWAAINIYANPGQSPTIEVKYNPDYGTPKVIFVPMRVPQPVEFGHERAAPPPERTKSDSPPAADRSRVRIEPAR